MPLPITGLHHVTSIASDAQANNDFFTRTLGLRRVKKTVNFDSPDTYHLYYGDAAGSPGSVMTYFPFEGVGAGRPGSGEVGTTAFAVPKGALPYWAARFAARGVENVRQTTLFGERRLTFAGPDGDGFALVEVDGDARLGWTGAGIGAAEAIHGFHAATLRLRDGAATAELLGFMGYQPLATEGTTTRYALPGSGAARVLEVEVAPGLPRAGQGAGSVHHIAFAVPDRAAQLEVRTALMDTGYQVTPVIDRDYFWAIYFRSPGGVLFEVATAEPGFDRDEAPAGLGQALKLPRQHEGQRALIEAHLPVIVD